MLVEKTDEYYMQKALELAQQAFDENEVPIGAIIVKTKRPYSTR